MRWDGFAFPWAKNEMIKLTRREFAFSSGAVGLVLAARPAVAATDFPRKDINFIIPYGPGGGFDSYVRVIAPVMEKYLPNKVHVVPTNVAAGGGGKGMSQLYRTPPDGYTIGIFNIPGAFILQQQQAGNGFDLDKFSWLGSLGEGESYAIGVRANSPLKTLADMQALSKTRPVKFTCTGPEGTAYSAVLISGEILGIRSQIISGYKSSNEYVVAAIRGDGDAVVAATSTMRRFVDGKQIRLLVDFEEHSSFAGVPDATTLSKPDLKQITVDRMVAAPPGLPADIKAVLQTALDKSVRDPAVSSWAKTAGIAWNPEPPSHAEAIIREQAAFYAKWKKYLTPA